MPSEKLTIDSWDYLKDLQLADPTYYQPSPIGILLGVEVYKLIYTARSHQRNPRISYSSTDLPGMDFIRQNSSRRKS